MARPKGSKNKTLPKHEPIPAEEIKEEVMTEETVSQMLEEAPAQKQIIIEQQSLSDTEKKRIQDERLVKGTFVYRAKPGGRYRTVMRKYRRSKHANNAQGFIKVDMTDGQTYTVPFWLAEWLNGEAEHSCADLKHDASNINLAEEERKPAQRVPVFRFIIQEWVDG